MRQLQDLTAINPAELVEDIAIFLSVAIEDCDMVVFALTVVVTQEGVNAVGSAR